MLFSLIEFVSFVCVLEKHVDFAVGINRVIKLSANEFILKNAIKSIFGKMIFAHT